MSISNHKKTIFLALILSVILACSPLTSAAPQPAATLDALYTAAAQTLNAMSTQGAATLTLQPSPTSPLSIPTSSPIALQTFTPAPPVTKCDAASFVTDVTYPDGSNVGIGVAFTKIWRVKNTGACAWTPSYSLAFVSGEKFGAPNAVSLPGNVAPGQSVDIAVQMTAPNKSGKFKGYWELRNASGVLFGVGASGEQAIYIDVNISGYTVSGYDLLEKACDAEWRNASRALPCPGTDGDNKGFALIMNSPKMENGSVQTKGLITHPEKVNDGVITGKYPAIAIQSGDRFQAWINCLDKANDCDAIFKLQYQIGNGNVQTLGQWREVYEGQYYAINVDLSSLSGQNVKLILTVLANGSSHEDYALWIAPRVARLSSQPPTSTFTPTLSPTATVTRTQTVTATFTPSPSPTVTATGTQTATATVTATATPTASATATPTSTETPTPTATP